MASSTNPGRSPQPPKESLSLFRALDTLLARRPKRLPHPVVAFTEETDQGRAKRVVTLYAGRLRSTRVPHALAPDRPDVEALLDALESALALDKTAGRLRRGFPRLRTCRAVLSATQRGDRRRLLDELYDEFTGRHAFLDSLEKAAAALPAPLAAPARVVLQRPLLRWSYGVWLRRRLRWVPRLTGNEPDVLTYVGTRPPELIADLRERILVEAFLRDLEWQVRSSYYSVGRLRRRWPFVLLLPEARHGSTAWRFVRECAETLGPRDRRQRPLRRTPVLVLAACGDRPPVPEAGVRSIDAGATALLDAARALRPAPSGPDRKGSPPLLLVPVPAEENGRTSGGGLTRLDDPSRRNHWYDRLLPVGSVVLTVALLAGAAYAVVTPLRHYPHSYPCEDTWQPSGGDERVGITDGTCRLSDDPELLPVQRTIGAQNARVEAMWREDPAHHPYRTVVVFSPLTVPDAQSGHIGHDSLDELRGVALAQDDAFRAARHDPTVVPIRVLLANSGDRFAAGPSVASRIVDRAADDETIAAVIGISQSRTESHEAIRRLSALQVPIIGSTTTSDPILDSSPLYYEIAPRNSREAEAVAQFLDHQPIKAGPHGETVRTTKAIVIEDPRDEYSQNLAEDFRRSFAAVGGVTVHTFDYGPGEDGRPYRDPGGINDTPEPSAGQLVKDLCTMLGSEPDVVFYASRAQQLPAMLDKTDQEAACAGRQLGVVGSDEDTRYIADGTIDLASYGSVHFYNAAFSDVAHHSTPVAQRFAARYAREYGHATDDSGASDAYDAFNAASMAINLSYQQDPSIPRGVAATKMADGLVRFTGVTGLITFDGAHDVTRVPLDKPIFMVFERPQGPETLMACGRYADGNQNQWTTWGKGRFPCPHDPPR
jgi:ABC-type branched-subunit amino acid transport system substrate-binding protein